MAQSKKKFDARKEIYYTLVALLGRLPTRTEYKLELSKRKIYVSKRTITNDSFHLKFLLEEETGMLKEPKNTKIPPKEENSQATDIPQQSCAILENPKGEDSSKADLTQPIENNQQRGAILEISEGEDDTNQNTPQTTEKNQQKGAILENKSARKKSSKEIVQFIPYETVKLILGEIKEISPKVELIMHLKDNNLIQEEVYQIEMMRILKDSHVIDKYTFMKYERAHQKRLERYQTMRVKTTLIMV
jgi:hypothetical protein